MAGSLANRGALIMGGTRGIGLATARCFGREGARLVVCGREPASGSAAVARLDADGAEACYVRADVCDGASVEAAVAEAREHLGRIDCAFNNAGWEGTAEPVHAVGEADWLRMIDTKLNGVWRGVRAQLRVMLEQGGGSIVNMAGSFGLVGFPGYASYCAAAHGILGLTKTAALEVAANGIRVNAVCPAAVDAPMLDRMLGGSEEVKRELGSALAIGRVCTPDEVAEAVVWLASDRASYVNGASLTLNGGGAP